MSNLINANMGKHIKFKARFVRAMLALCLLSLPVEMTFAQINLTTPKGKLENVVGQIKKKTKYRFFYNDELAKVQVNAVQVKDASIRTILDRLLAGTNITYRIAGQVIYLSKSASTSSQSEGTQQRGTATGKKRSCSGTVVDAKGEPIIGATIKRPGASTGTITDVDGHFTIDVPEGSTLQISYIGYEDREVRASANMNITLKSNVENLNEVVVVGYGTQKKVDLTGAVSSVKMDDVLGNRPISSVSEALQGAIPGLQVTSTSGIPGKGMSFNIRGVNSINTGSPLVLVDNVEMDVNMLDPNDIESVTVLKDAASSAIYGARAAFGVILITTKKGNKESAFHLNYSNNFAFSDATNVPKKATPLQTVQAYKDQGVISCSTGQDVDTWLELLKDYQNNPNAYPNGYVDVNGLR